VRGGRRCRRTSLRSLRVGCHGSPEGVLLKSPCDGFVLQSRPGDGFVDVPQLADSESFAEEVFGIGVVDIPPA
jgi:hypothetical protein